MNQAVILPFLKEPQQGPKLSSAIDDNSLLIKIATDRCEESFRVIFSVYSTKIYSFGISQKMTDSAARELVQETMTTVWVKSHLFKPERGKASTWIYTIARNLRYDLLRKHVRESRVISSEDLYEVHIADSDTQDDSDLIQKLQSKELLALVETLPETQKQAVEAVFFSGYTHEEFAHNKDIPLGTVKSRIRLALRKLHQLLEKT